MVIPTSFTVFHRVVDLGRPGPLIVEATSSSLVTRLIGYIAFLTRFAWRTTIRTVSVVEWQHSYTFEAAGEIRGKLMATHGAGGRLGGITQGRRAPR